MATRWRIPLLIGVMAAVAAAAAGISIFALYEAALVQQRARLVETAQGQAHLIAAIALHETKHPSTTQVGIFERTLRQVRVAHEKSQGIGRTGEFTLARQEGSRIVFLLDLRNPSTEGSPGISMNSELAEPMRRALLGESGTLVGTDYRGVQVLAAHEPVGALGLGIVAKIDMDEVRAPFIQAGLLATCASGVLILLGVLLFRRIGAPLLARMEESEHKYRTLFESATDGVFLMCPETAVFLDCNQQAEVILGCPRSEILGRTPAEFSPSHQPNGLTSEEAAKERIAAALSGTFQLFEWEHFRADGTEFRAGISVKAVKVGGREMVLASMRDISEQARTERALRENLALLEGVLEGSNDAIFVKSNEGRYTFANPATCRALGRQADQLVGSLDTDLFPSETARLFRESELRVLSTGEPETQEVVTNGESGRRLWRVTKAPYRDPDAGENIGVIGLAHDITERKRGESVRNAIFRIAEAAATTESLDHLYRAIHEALAGLMPAKNFYIALLESSTGLLRFPYFRDERDGHPGEVPADHCVTGEVLRRGSSILLRGEEIEKMMGRLPETPRGTAPVGWLGVMLRSDERPIGVMAVQSYEEGIEYGEEEREILEVVAVQVGLAIDRKLAQAHRHRLATIVEQTSEVIIQTNEEGVIRYVNPAFEEVTGYSAREAVGQSVGMLESGVHPREFMEEMWRTLRSGEPWYGRFVNRHKDGTTFEMDSRIVSLRDEEGEVIGYVSAQRDVSQEMRLEEQLRQAQKMEAVGQLAGGIAHDFNNLLTAITGYSEILMRRLPEDDPQHNRAAQINDAARRGESLTRQLLTFSRKQILQPRVLDLNHIVTTVESMLGRIIGEDVELVTELEPGAGRVRADAGQVEQVLLNLAVNARDAMPEGGHLTISTRNIDVAAGCPGLDGEPGLYVCLTVRDTGLGMDAETIERAFEPFFTTKDRDRGTGLGLATVYGIVKQSEGFVTVESELGKGTEFLVHLPAVEEELTSDTEPDLAAGSGTETVLLVEDDDSVRILTDEILKEYGYAVLNAADPKRALELAEQHRGGIHLLLTDVVLPGMSGVELANRLSETEPEARVLFMSGYTEGEVSRKGVFDPEHNLLQKPFGPAELANRLREVLGS